MKIRNLLILGIGVFFSASILFAAVNTMYNWECTKCFTVVQKDGSPNTGSCPAKGGHSWSKLGKVGNNQYQCRKCGMSVASDMTPNYLKCPNGGTHSWSKL